MTSRDAFGQFATQLLDALPSAVLVVNDKNTILYANAAANRAFSHCSGGLLGRSLTDIAGAPDSIVEDLAERLRQSESWQGHLGVRRGDGCMLSVRASRADWNGQVSYVCVVEETPEPHVSEEQFQTLADSMPNLAWIAHADGYIFWYNRRWYEYTGTTPAEMRGWGWQSVHDPNMLPVVLERWQRSLAERKPFDMVFPLRGADGKFRPFLTRGVPLFNSEGAVDRWFGTNTDVSAQVEAETALRTVEDRLLRVVYASSRLLQSMTVAQVLADTVEIAPGLIQAAAAAVWRADADGCWSVVASKGLSPEYLRHCRGIRGPALDGTLLVIPDVQANAVAQVRNNVYAAEGIRGMLCVPLQIRGGMNGSLVFYFHEVHEFTDGEREIASALGNVAASALASAEMFEREADTRRRAEAGERRAAFLADAAAILHSSMQVDSALSDVAAVAVPQFAGYMRIDMGGRILTEVPAGPAPENHIEVTLPPMAALEARIVFGSWDPAHDWDEEDVRLLEELAVRIAVALENARLHREVREAGERANLAMEAAELGTWDYDMLSRRITWSSRTRAFFGVSERAPITPERFLALIHPDDTHRVVAALAQADRGDRPGDHLEYRVLLPDGSVRWLLSNGCTLFEGDGPNRRAVRMIGVVRDITAARDAEQERQALLAREQEARSTAELLNGVGPLLLAELDRDRLVQKLLDICSRLVGAQHAKLTSDWALWDVLRVGDCHIDPEFAKRPPFGDAVVRSLLAVPVHAHTGESFGTLVFGHPEPNMFGPREEQLATGVAAQAAIALDNARLFEEALRVQEALHKANESLRAANSDLEQFAFAAAHDLREPLRMVTTYTQLLERKLGPQLDPQFKPFMKHVVDGATRMFDLLQDLLSYTNTATQHEPAGPVDIGAAVQTAVNNLDSLIQENGAEIRVGRMPVISARMGHMVLVFQNLIGNALKYRRKDVTPVVDVSAEAQNGHWLIRVCDNGIGIDSHYHAQIFGVFKRLHGKEIPGTGIGLAICQRAVERAGGRIWVESTPGHGATFLFTLPARASESD